MKPNKTGIGEFKFNGRKVNAVHLFGKVFKAFAWTPQHIAIDIGFILDEVAFLHDCQSRSAYYINENGYCTQCGKFLATHKKLEVMAGLKEMTG